MSTKIYLAAPLFDDMELERNLRLCHSLEELGFKVFLPQRDAGEAFEHKPRAQIFNSDVMGVNDCDVLVACIDGRVPDEGTVFEMGMAYAFGKAIHILSTDRRSFMDGHPNVMLEYCGHWHQTQQALTYVLKETYNNG